MTVAQAEVEKERENAKIAVDNLRGELERVRAYVAARSRSLPQATGSSGAVDEAATRGWQLFGHCAKEYAGLAEIADTQRNDLAEWQAYGRVVAGTVDK